MRGGAFSPARGAGRADSPALAVDVLLDESTGTIKPALYGQFAEHIGGVIYDGIWVGPESKIANIDGIRQRPGRARPPLGPVVVRWPGGCFADKYHWRDGIGPRDKRPRRFGRWREETETNQFGTHEFMRFCRLVRRRAVFRRQRRHRLAEEFQQWVEYCNAPAGSTTLADERVANGDREPFGVRYWGVGNESWGCGGKFIPEDYCRNTAGSPNGCPSTACPLPDRRRPQRQRPRLDATVLPEWATVRAPDPRLGAALLLRDDRACAQVHPRPVVRAAPQGQPHGDADQGPVGRDGRIRSASTASS